MEITQDLDLDEEQKNLLVMHSALNILNTLLYELVNLVGNYGESPYFSFLEERIMLESEKLRNRESSQQLLQNTEQFISWIKDQLRTWNSQAMLTNDDGILFEESMENIDSIFEILRIRARELIARFQKDNFWETFSIKNLTENFLMVMKAIEKNAKGRFRIVYNSDEHDESSYIIQLKIGSFNKKTVGMPSVFQDIIRDLLANSRKYTQIGGAINAEFFDDEKEIRFVITDNGMGIPTEEIPKVFTFGSRGKNAKGKQTRGGGFGLTKAYYYTKFFGGRFWIESDLGKGTKIEIRIPRNT